MSDYDGGGLLADLCAKLDLHIGSVNSLTKELSKPKPKPKIPAQPVFGRVRASGIAPSSGVLALIPDQPGPEQGRFWYIRSIVVGGLSPTVSAAGRADVYVSGMIPTQTITLAALGLSDWRDQAATLPAVAFYGRGELPMRMNENLAIVISGATSGQQYVAAIQFEEYQEGAVREEWGI